MSSRKYFKITILKKDKRRVENFLYEHRRDLMEHVSFDFPNDDIQFQQEHEFGDYEHELELKKNRTIIKYELPQEENFLQENDLFEERPASVTKEVQGNILVEERPEPKDRQSKLGETQEKDRIISINSFSKENPSIENLTKETVKSNSPKETLNLKDLPFFKTDKNPSRQFPENLPKVIFVIRTCNRQYHSFFRSLYSKIDHFKISGYRNKTHSLLKTFEGQASRDYVNYLNNIDLNESQMWAFVQRELRINSKEPRELYNWACENGDYHLANFLDENMDTFIGIYHRDQASRKADSETSFENRRKTSIAKMMKTPKDIEYEVFRLNYPRWSTVINEFQIPKEFVHEMATGKIEEKQIAFKVQHFKNLKRKSKIELEEEEEQEEEQEQEEEAVRPKRQLNKKKIKNQK